MDIDYLLIILPGIVFLGISGLILVIWQYGNFRNNKEASSTTSIHATTTPITNDNYYSTIAPNEASLIQTPSSKTEKKQASIQEALIILQLLAAEERPYRGYELLQTLSSAGFHYGKMNIFHYYSDSNEKKERLFSVASAIEPGTFDLNHIGEILTPGLCLFMPINTTRDHLNIFELMLETAQLLIQDLGGILCDSQRQPLTPHLITQYRSQLYAYV